MIKKSLPVLLLILFSGMLIITYFSTSLFSLNSILFVDGGDGIKNYFTFLYYVKYDIGTQFTGMNYPYGENVVFTDNMPILAWLVKYVGLSIPLVTKYALGIMHGSFMISLVVAVIYVYKIIKNFKVDNWLAIPASLFIIFFSPQLFKFYGHFGMAYLMYLPMQIYWVIKYDRSLRLKYPVYIAITASIFSFIHVYNLAFSLVMCCSYLLAKFIVSCKYGWKKYLKTIIPLLCSVLIAGIVFSLVLKITDAIDDRTVYPYGIFGGRTTGSDIFLSNISPLGFILQFIFGKAPGPSESYAYVGLVSTVISLILIIYLIRFIAISLSKKNTSVALHPVREFRLWLLVSIFMLLFGMGVPFVWNMQFLADYISVFRQFRVMGRFTWAFYYLFMIFSVIVIFRFYHWMVRKKYKWQARTIVAIVITIWGIQLSGYAQFFQKSIGSKQSAASFERFNESDSTNWVHWLKEKGYEANQFQAILALPFFHIGSEKLWLQDNNEGLTMYYSSQFAMQTGIPMADVMMSRTSWAQTFANVQTIDGPLSSKPALGMYSDKLVIVLVNKTFPLKPKEMEWTQLGKFIGTRDNLDLYAVNIKDVLSYDEHFTDSLKSLALANPGKEGLIHDAGEFYFVDHFEKGSDEFLFFGNKSYNPVVRTEYQLIATIKPDISKEKMLNYFFSIWVKCSDNDYRSPYFIFKQYDKDNNFLGESDLNTKYSTHIYDYWFLIDKVLTFEPNMDRMEIYVVSQQGERSYFALAEMAIWPINKFYFHKVNENKVLINNRIN